MEYDTESRKAQREKKEQKLKLLEEMEGKNKTLEEIKNEYYKRTGVHWQTWDISETARRYEIKLKALDKQKNKLEKKRNKEKLVIGEKYNVMGQTPDGNKDSRLGVRKNLTYVKQDEKTLYFRHDKGFIVTFPNHNFLTKVQRIR